MRAAWRCGARKASAKAKAPGIRPRGLAIAHAGPSGEHRGAIPGSRERRCRHYGTQARTAPSAQAVAKPQHGA